jgi:hypothetical protein
MVSDPDKLLFPLQSPDAVQLSASVLLQLKVVEPPLVTVVGLAERETVGCTTGSSTLTLTESLPVPPVPLQDRLKVLLAVNELMLCDPELALLPDQSPDAVQLSAPVLLQLKVVEPPLVTVVGLAERETVGCTTGSSTVILTKSIAVPPAPLQVKI